MAQGTKRSPKTGKSTVSKKQRFTPQPIPDNDGLSDNEATFYESAEDGSFSDSSDISDSSGEKVDNMTSKDPGSDSDELDELDDLDEEEGKNSSQETSDHSEDEDTEKYSTDPNKKSSAEQHAEQKKILSERKLKRKSGAEVEQIKSLWEKLRVKKPAPPPQMREKLCNEIWELSKGVIYDLVLKHDASRVVQTLVKYTTKDRRDLIVVALKGNYYKLATSSYGKYLMVKLLHYGSKESRALIVDELHGKFRKLMRHKEGAYVAEDLYVLYSSAEQKQQIIREFWGAEYAVFKESGKDGTVLNVVNKSAERRQLVMSNLIGTITASIAKGLTGFQILHAAMRDYVTILMADPEKNDADIRTLIDLLAEQFAELVHTQEGSEVACFLIAVASAKERKVIIKSLKDHAEKLIENEYGNLVLITLFMTVDDTVLLHKSFGAELISPDRFPQIIQEKFARRPFLYLLKGLDGKYFSPKVKEDLTRYEKLAYTKTTKKPQDQRRDELLSKALPLMYKSLIATVDSKNEMTLNKLLSLNLAAQFITELCLKLTDNEEINDELRPQMVDGIFDLTFKFDVLEDHHLINKTPFFSRTLKALIQGNELKWDKNAKKLFKVEGDAIPSIGTQYAEKIAEALAEDHMAKNWVSGQGSFVILALLEALEAVELSHAKSLKKTLKKFKKDMTKDTENRGAQLLVNQL